MAVLLLALIDPAREISAVRFLLHKGEMPQGYAPSNSASVGMAPSPARLADHVFMFDWTSFIALAKKEAG